MGGAALGSSVRGSPKGIPTGHQQDRFEFRAFELMDLAEMLPNPLELHRPVAPGTARPQRATAGWPQRVRLHRPKKEAPRSMKGLLPEGILRRRELMRPR